MPDAQTSTWPLPASTNAITCLASIRHAATTVAATEIVVATNPALVGPEAINTSAATPIRIACRGAARVVRSGGCERVRCNTHSSRNASVCNRHRNRIDIGAGRHVLQRRHAAVYRHLVVAIVGAK